MPGPSGEPAAAAQYDGQVHAVEDCEEPEQGISIYLSIYLSICISIYIYTYRSPASSCEPAAAAQYDGQVHAVEDCEEPEQGISIYLSIYLSIYMYIYLYIYIPLACFFLKANRRRRVRWPGARCRGLRGTRAGDIYLSIYLSIFISIYIYTYRSPASSCEPAAAAEYDGQVHAVEDCKEAQQGISIYPSINLYVYIERPRACFFLRASRQHPARWSGARCRE